MFAALKNEIQNAGEIQTEKDVAGGGFRVLETGIYPAKITMAYTGVAKSGAHNVTVHFKTDSQELRETFYVTSGTEKGTKPFFINKDGNKEFLPGYNIVESLCALTVGKHAYDVETEDKVIKLYNYDLKKEAPTQVPVIVDLLDQEIYIAVEKQIVDKNVKGADGRYVPSGETREQNEIVKVFRASDKMTTAEILAGAEEANFYNTWVEKNAGKTRNKASKTAGTAGAPTAAPAPVAQAQAGAARPSLFGN